MKRITFTSLACLTFVTALVAGAFAPQAIAATPNPNSAVVKTRIFNDCPFTTINVVNNYPSLLSVEDTGLACSAFANLHNWSFSEDGTSAALFPNDSDFRFSADVMLSGTSDGEAGLRLSPWWSPDVDGRFNIRTPDGEIACFGGRLPFYSFTAVYGLHYAKGEPIHLQMTYKPHALNVSSPATIEYELTYQGINYSSGALNFDQANPAEDPPHGLWGMLNDARAGGYFQPRMVPGNFTAALKATFTNVKFVICPIAPDPAAAMVKTRIFNDCPFTLINVVNNYPSLVSIEDVGLACSGFANLHDWTLSNDGIVETVINNDEDFSIATDFTMTGKGEGGLRVSPWWSHDVDGLFNVRSTDGEIACFGGRLPFYSFTGAHGLHYLAGNPIHLQITYKHNGLSAASPGTIQYDLTYLGNSYSSGPLNFDQANPAEDPPHGLWGILNDARVGGHMKAFMTPGDFSATTKATFTNIVFHSTVFHSGVNMAFDLTPDALNLKSNGNWVTGYLTPPAPYSASDIDVSSLRLNGQVGPSGPVGISGNTLAVKFSRVAVQGALGQDGAATVTGDVGGACFRGSDVVKVLHITSPTAASSHGPGSVINVRWTTPAGTTASSASIYSSTDNGENWSAVAENLPNTESYDCTAPATLSNAARVAVVLDDGTTDGIAGISGAFSIETALGVDEPVAVEFALRGVTPNPTRGDGVHVGFSLPNSRQATLSLYDVSGRRVAFREVGGMGPGRHTVTLAQRLPAGMYVVRLSQGGRSLSTRAAVVR